MAGGDAYKGTELADRTDDNPVMRFELSAASPLLRTKWECCYDGIGQANNVLKIIRQIVHARTYSGSNFTTPKPAPSWPRLSCLVIKN